MKKYINTECVHRVWGKVETFNITAHYAKCMWLLNKDIRFGKCSVNEFIILTFYPSQSRVKLRLSVTHLSASFSINRHISKPQYMVDVEGKAQAFLTIRCTCMCVIKIVGPRVA